MGSAFSTSRNCVGVWCEKSVYYSGDIIQGHVLLNVIEPIVAASVNVEVYGAEKTHWIRVEQRTEKKDGPKGPEYRTVTERHPHWAKREFFRVNVPLTSFGIGQPLPPGQYQFPFRIVLPTNMPGSFHYEEGNHGSYEHVVGRIKYKVAAEVVQHGVPKQAGKKGKRHRLHEVQEIMVRQRLMRPPSELVAEDTTHVKFCCCSSRGMVTVRLRADKDSYTAGETAYMLFEIENRTQLAYPDVWLKVERVVTLKTHGDTFCQTDKVFKQKFPGLGPGESRMGANAQRLAFPSSPSLVPTTISSLVSCSYRAWVELSAGALTNNPKLCVPLTIYTAPPPHVVYTAPPEFWHPQQVYPSVEVKLPAPSAPPMDNLPSAPPLDCAPPAALQEYTKGGTGGYAPQPQNAQQSGGYAPQQQAPYPPQQQYAPPPQQQQQQQPQYTQQGGGYTAQQQPLFQQPPPPSQQQQQYGGYPPQQPQQYGAFPPEGQQQLYGGYPPQQQAPYPAYGGRA